MKLKTSGLGLIALGILLLGAQLVLYLGFKNVYPLLANNTSNRLHRPAQLRCPASSVQFR
jgi:hypothetical protein